MKPRDVTFVSQIFAGSKLGRTISFPTLNLDPAVFPKNKPPGVYAAWVWISEDPNLNTSNSKIMQLGKQDVNKRIGGALYFGPRLVHQEEHNVLEIFLLHFSKEVYNKYAIVQILEFIRPPLHFASMSKMQEQLSKDVTAIQITLEQQHTDV